MTIKSAGTRREPHPPGRGPDPAAGRSRRLALFHRPHPHALDRPQGVPEERPCLPRGRHGLHHRGRSALASGTARGRDLLASDRALLDGPGAARPRRPDAEAMRRRQADLFAPVAGAAESDRARRGRTAQGRGQRLHVVGVDCLDNTPLLDIKPYFSSTDSIPDARAGWHARNFSQHECRHGRAVPAIHAPSQELAWMPGIKPASRRRAVPTFAGETNDTQPCRTFSRAPPTNDQNQGGRHVQIPFSASPPQPSPASSPHPPRPRRCRSFRSSSRSRRRRRPGPMPRSKPKTPPFCPPNSSARSSATRPRRPPARS